MYRCEAKTVAGFIQQLAVSYVAKGYFFYVTGIIPEEKEPGAIDEKLISRYGVSLSKWARARRKRGGMSNVQYLRFERFFVIIATKGEHSFFELEPKFKDIRRVPIKFSGYSIGYRRGQGSWHPSVRIERGRYLEVKAYFENLSVHRSAGFLSEEFHRLPFEPYAPVRQQLLNILRAVNRARKLAGLELVPLSALRLRRGQVQPFEEKRVAA